MALLLPGFLFAALQALAHPFTHVQACNTDGRIGAIRSEPALTGEVLFRSEISLRPFYNGPMASQVPSAIHGQKYISLTTFRKTGVGVSTPVWFGEADGKLYVMTRSDMGKSKRIRNNPQVNVAPCTIRGKVMGPEFAATARILPPEEHKHARTTINRKYWMARIPLVWARTDTYFEITIG